MFKRIYTSDAFEALKAANYGKACYSWDGVKTLLDYYDEIDERMEFDACSIMGEWTEYGCSFGECFTRDDLITDYGYLLEREDDEDELDYAERLAHELERHTTVLYTNSCTCLVAAF